jgi:hypothetical protein
MTRDVESSSRNKDNNDDDDDADDVPLDLMKRSFFCAANPKLAKEILEAISEGRSAYESKSS